MNDNVFIVSLLPDKEGMVVLELGTGNGDCTILLGEVVRRIGGKVLTIDKVKTAGKYISDSYRNIVYFRHGDLFEVAEQVKDQVFDAIFFDAVCSYPECKDALILWLPKLKPGGIAIGHGADFYWSRTPVEMRNQMIPMLENHLPEIEMPMSDDLIEILSTKDMWKLYLTGGDRGITHIRLHAGLSLSLYEVFRDDYNVCGEHTVWWKIID